ncbi:MAG: tetratricopeptide repeat protein [Pirellulales bacterium]
MHAFASIVVLLLAADPFSVGQRVMPKVGAKVRIGETLSDGAGMTMPWTVRQVDGQWLLIDAERKAWAKASDVIGVADAPSYYTEIIRGKRSAAAYHARALAWMELDEYDKAIEDCTDSIRIDPKLTQVYVTRANSYNMKGDLPNALKDANSAIALDSKSSSAFICRGNVWSQQGDTDRAIQDFSEAIILDPKSPLARVNRAVESYKKQDIDSAVADCEEAVRVAPTYIRAFQTLGYLQLLGLKQVAQAERSFLKAIQLDPNDTVSLNELAWLYATCPYPETRNGKRAVEFADRCCRLSNYSDPSLIDTLAAAYAERGDFDLAAEWQEKAMAINKAEDYQDEAGKRLALYREKKPYHEVLRP